jgi:hypothetical protein
MSLERENKVVRHVRRLLPLAFLSPRVVDAVAGGSASALFTVTLLTGSLPHSWAQRERRSESSDPKADPPD